ncbi:unnamed protein product [Linum trigynum]|uniref:Uncharacterized protein n=1 Tax=Linum trigynum TaxID=586398 RepID=A0AAV2DBP0_9ROSI
MSSSKLFDQEWFRLEDLLHQALDRRNREARRCATPIEMSADDDAATTEEAAGDSMPVVKGVGVDDADATPNIIIAEQPRTIDKAFSTSARATKTPPPTASSSQSHPQHLQTERWFQSQFRH